MRLNLSNTIRRLATHTITVEPVGLGGYDDTGTAVRDAPGPAVTTPACVHPLKGRDVELLPEGASISDSRAILSPIQLHPNDLITVPGVGVFRLVTAEPWGEVAGYWRGIGIGVR